MQHRFFRWIVVLSLIALSQVVMLGAAGQDTPDFTLTSASVGDNGVLGAEYAANGFGCTGENLSPELSWTGAPEGTQSYGLTIYDVDALTGSGFWHWVMFNIPATESTLAEGAGDPAANLAPEGSVQSRNDVGLPGYLGPCPRPGDKAHRYLITLYALNTDAIPLDETASGALAGFYLNGSVIAKTTLTLLYGQPSDFQLTSASVGDDGAFADEYSANGFGCTGENLSPELSWTGAPEGTQSYGLTVYDIDAPTGSGFWHWVIFNIPATETSLVEGAGDPSSELAPEGSVQSLNDVVFPGYLGPCPPEGNHPHRYLITLYALNTDAIPLDETATGALAGFYLNGSTIAKTSLVITYMR